MPMNKQAEFAVFSGSSGSSRSFRSSWNSWSPESSWNSRSSGSFGSLKCHQRIRNFLETFWKLSGQASGHPGLLGTDPGYTAKLLAIFICISIDGLFSNFPECERCTKFWFPTVFTTRDYNQPK